MIDLAPRRPWWKKRRWLAALPFWVAGVWLLLGGPSQYACRREWLSGQAVRPVYLPAWTGILDVPVLGPVYLAYCDWWVELADRHRASAD